MKRPIIITLIILAVAIVNGCKNDNYEKLYPTSAVPVTCDTTTISYAKDIKPILVASCYNPGAGCHDVAGSNTSNYNFTTYDGIVDVAQGGLLLPDINWESGHNAMPKDNPKLSQCDINKFTRWVNQGALNN